uniref:Uncharacterized protein n=1 Tax=Solanum tuberosum TaxID=4113 RepID=M0ZX01_SOLTU
MTRLSRFRSHGFKRLFERQFSGLLRSSAPEKLVTGEDLTGNKKDASEEFEPSSVCLAKMVHTFIEEGEDKHRCNQNRCNCFNCNGTESSEEETDSVNCFGESNQNCCSDACEILKVLPVLRPCSAFKADLGYIWAGYYVIWVDFKLIWVDLLIMGKNLIKNR